MYRSPFWIALSGVPRTHIRHPLGAEMRALRVRRHSIFLQKKEREYDSVTSILRSKHNQSIYCLHFQVKSQDIYRLVCTCGSILS
jgi:hypothetical protein